MSITLTDLGKSALAIAVALIIGSIGWVASNVIKLDKEQALTAQQVDHIGDQITTILDEVRDVEDRLSDYARETSQERSANSERIEELDQTIKQVGANLEDQIGRIKRGGP